ncbi:Beta-barrel assembly machine subunit BamA [Palleronia marisminoris]|uniref:Outer membrane protein assembly factor BamA n=1 Tax=Palleronia marisminoris TaxID=315423 RepID=A0A1Y5RCL8_9RHOB|nr:outer membrane protein assembly factor BamA [Palleronia marisminoris]SFG08326.1 Beta-barrel assembly machine subunit BamA [Palleronia marisminoris]SLN11569.1 Outer membrane protein assembly factor BamA precursor [Palleronia marisminoris]
MIETKGRAARTALLASALQGAVLAGFSAGAVVAATSAAVAQSYQFSDIQVVGNQRVDTATVVNTLAIPQGRALSAGELNAAYQRLAGAGIFETVSITPQGGTLLVEVAEYPTVSRISFEGNSQLDNDELTALIGSVPNRVYNPSRAEEDARAIAAAYEARGRLAASVTPRIIRRANNRVDLVFEIAEGGIVEIERISFVGNQAYSDRRLRRALATKQAGFLRQIIQRDTFVAERVGFDQQLLRDFYLSRGYIDFTINDVSNEFSRDRDAFFVQYNITEGQSWDFGQVTTSTTVPGLNAAEYTDLVGIRAGQTYTPAAIDAATERLEEAASRRGMTFVRATPQITRNPQTLELNVNFLLERGPRVFVERIDIEGNQTTLDRVIRRQFRTVEGDPFNPREIRAAAERIRALGYFSDVQAEGREGSSPDQVVIDVDVVEQPTGSLSLGGSYSTDSGFGVSFGFTERNFLGRGQTLAFDVTTGTNANSAQFSFVEPYFLGRDLRAGFEVFYSETDYDEADYNTRSVGFSPSVTFPTSENGRLQVRYRLAEDSLEDVGDDISPIIAADEGSSISSALGYTYSYDTRRSGIDPNTGIVLRFGQDLAGLGGDVNYVKSVAFGGYQTTAFSEEVNIRAVVEGGNITAFGDSDSVRLTDRFFLSTSQLRGFEPLGVGPRDLVTDDALGGNNYAVARVEADFPLGLPEEYGIRGGVFLDAGSVWGLDNTEGADGETVDDSAILRSSVGVSLFWDTPFGPLRFNFAEALAAEDYDNTRTFNVSLSSTF